MENFDLKKMKEFVIKWIETNSESIKKVVTLFAMIDILLVAISIIAGNFIALVLVSLRIVLVEVLLVVPAVMIMDSIDN